MASEYRFIEFFEIFREGCFQGDFFWHDAWKPGCRKQIHQLKMEVEI